MDYNNEPEHSNQNETRKTPKPSAAVTVFSAVIVLTIFVGLPVWFFSAISSQGEPQAKDLDLSIKTAGSDLQIRNNEPGELRNCTVEINGGYTARISSIGGEYGTYELSSFTKGDGERFNNLTHSVNSVVVDRCLNEDGRVGVYGN